MKNNTTNEDNDFLEQVRGVLLITYGVDYSVQQIREAYVIAKQLTDLFHDSLEIIYRKKYGGEQK